MLPGRNLEALQSIGQKGVNRGRGGRQTDAEEEREDGRREKTAQEHEDTKRREHREASRGGG